MSCSLQWSTDKLLLELRSDYEFVACSPPLLHTFFYDWHGWRAHWLTWAWEWAERESLELAWPCSVSAMFPWFNWGNSLYQGSKSWRRIKTSKLVQLHLSASTMMSKINNVTVARSKNYLFTLVNSFALIYAPVEWKYGCLFAWRKTRLWLFSEMIAIK